MEVGLLKMSIKTYNKLVKSGVTLCILVSTVAVVYLSQYIRTCSPREYVVTVTEKVNYPNYARGKDMVYGTTLNGEVVKLEDTKESSCSKTVRSGFFNTMEVGKTYRVKTVGAEVLIFSNYRNIVEVGDADTDGGNQ